MIFIQKIRFIILRIATQLLAIFYSSAVLIPVLWVFLSSIRPNLDFFKNPTGLPSELFFQNFINAWSEENVSIYFRNTVFLTIVSVFLIIIVSTFAAYALTRLKFFGRVPLLLIFVSGLFISPALLLLPLFLLLQDLNLLNSYFGLIMVYIAYSLPFTIFILIPFFNVIPKEIEEAAFIDGASHFQIFFKMIVRLAKPGIILATIFNIFGIWNEIILAYVLIMDDNLKTLPVGLAILLNKQHYTADFGKLFAAVVIAIVPISIIYIIFQNKLTGNLMKGSLKE